MRHILKKEDYLIMGEIINNSYNMLDILDDLALLELNEEKDSDNYSKNIFKLKKCLKYEKNLYNYIFKDINKTKSFLDFLGESEDIYDLRNNLDIIVHGTDEERAKSRFGLILVEYLSSNLDRFDNESLEKEDDEEDEMSISGEVMVSKSVKDDLINTILLLLNNYEKSKDYEDIKEYLTGLKYGIAFNYSKVLDEYVINNFNSDKPLYWVANYVADLNDISEEEVNNYRNSYYLTLLDNYLSDIALSNEDDLEDEDAYAELVYELLFIHSGLFYASEENKELLKNEIQEKLLSVDAENINKNAIVKLIEVIDSSKKEKDIPQKIRALRNK